MGDVARLRYVKEQPWERLAAESPIFFIKINAASTRPIPTAKTKFQKTDNNKTTSIIITSLCGI